MFIFNHFYSYIFLTSFHIFKIRTQFQNSVNAVVCVCVCILGQAQEGVGTENRWMDILQNRRKISEKNREVSLKKILIIFCMQMCCLAGRKKLVYILILKILFEIFFGILLLEAWAVCFIDKIT